MTSTTRYHKIECPECGDFFQIEEYTHDPGGARLGYETMLTVFDKDCGCEDKDNTDLMVNNRVESSKTKFE